MSENWCIRLTFGSVSFIHQESEGFFLHALRINPNAASCHGNLGKAAATLVAFKYFK